MKVFLRDTNKKTDNYRKEDKIPGILYGPDIENKPIYAEKKELIKFFKEHEFGFFQIEFEGKKLQATFREVQFHPITGEIIHFDLYIPPLKKVVEVKIPLEFIGEAPALKKGGIINYALKEVPVEGLLESIPEKIVVDLSFLEEIGQAIYVKDLNLPEGVKVLLDPNTVLVNIISETQATE